MKHSTRISSNATETERRLIGRQPELPARPEASPQVPQKGPNGRIPEGDIISSGRRREQRTQRESREAWDRNVESMSDDELQSATEELADELQSHVRALSSNPNNAAFVLQEQRAIVECLDQLQIGREALGRRWGLFDRDLLEVKEARSKLEQRLRELQAKGERTAREPSASPEKASAIEKEMASTRNEAAVVERVLELRQTTGE